MGAALLFLLAAAGGEWIVHQLQYLIEYGSQFGAQMAASPHRLYMGPVGTVLALSAVLGLALTALTLQVRAGRRRSLLHYLPERLRPAAMVERPRITVGQVASITLALLVCQVLIYLAQENVESVARGLSVPGLAVLFSPSHWTVLPLHVLLALADALILATLTGCLRSSRRALRTVETLVRLITRPRQAISVLTFPDLHLPCLRLSSGRLGLRSPPSH